MYYSVLYMARNLFLLFSYFFLFLLLSTHFIEPPNALATVGHQVFAFHIFLPTQVTPATTQKKKHADNISVLTKNCFLFSNRAK